MHNHNYVNPPRGKHGTMINLKVCYESQTSNCTEKELRVLNR